MQKTKQMNTSVFDHPGWYTPRTPLRPDYGPKYTMLDMQSDTCNDQEEPENENKHTVVELQSLACNAQEEPENDMQEDSQQPCYYQPSLNTYVFFNQMYIWKEFLKALPLVIGSEGKVLETRILDHYLYIACASIFTTLFAKNTSLKFLDFSDFAAIKSVTRGRYVYFLMDFILGTQKFNGFLKESQWHSVLVFIASAALGVLSIKFSTHTMNRDLQRISIKMQEENNDQGLDDRISNSKCKTFIHHLFCASLLLFPIGDMMDLFNVLSQELVDENPFNNETVVNGTALNSTTPSALTSTDIDIMTFASIGLLALTSAYPFYHAYDYSKLTNALYKIFAFLGDGARAYGSSSNLCWLIVATLSSLGIADENEVFSQENIPYFIAFCACISLFSGTISAIETEFNSDVAYYENNACIPSCI